MIRDEHEDQLDLVDYIEREDMNKCECGKPTEEEARNYKTNKRYTIKKRWRFVMGCFNTIKLKCKECKSSIEYQSKAGSCNLETYHINSSPLWELAELQQYGFTCDKCNTKHKVNVQTLVDYEIDEVEICDD